MIGYVVVNRDELKVKDLEMYQAFYCGVCQDIKKEHGQISRLTLSYEMTFLAMLLSSVYDERPKSQRLKCLMHPASRQVCVRNAYTGYAADMGIILSYHNLMDNWMDDNSRKSLLFADLIKKAYRKAAEKYPWQAKTVVKCMRETRKAEASGNYDLDLASGITGHMLEEIFIYKKDDLLSRDLGRMGFFLGKFIYLMDAYDDLKKDIKNGSYNPFIPISGQDDFEERAKEVMTMMAAEAAAAFERLPAIDYIDILRNVLYSGIWTKYNIIRRSKAGGAQGRRTGGKKIEMRK
jgi:hypothetical protein